MMGYFGYGGMGWIGMILGWLLMLGVLVGFILLIVWAVRRSSGGVNPPNLHNVPGQAARDFAQARYAKGEITRDEYQQILSDLSK